MKKNSFLWAALSMTAALVMTACSSNNDITEAPVAPSTSKTIPYTVTVGGDEATTRATVDADNKTLRFASGDKLYITGTNIQGILELQDGEGESSGATFSGELEYTGGGSPAANLELTATLVSEQQEGTDKISVDADGAVTVNYPDNAYCSSINDAVQKYSNLTGTSTYGDKSFTLTQQTAFLNFVITFEDGTATNTPLTAVVNNNSSEICSASVTTTTVSEKVVAKFVLPVASGTELSSATVTMGSKAALAISDATLTGKVYNVTRTQEKADASVTAPTAVAATLTYSGSAQTLFSAGSTTGGTMKYKVTTTNSKPASTADFKTTIDQGTNAGTYYLWYYVDGGDDYNTTDVNGTAVSKEIAKAAATLTCSNTAISFSSSEATNSTKTKTGVSCTGGTINVTSANTGNCTVSYSSGTITVTRKNNSAFTNTQITVSVTPDGNHTAPSNVTFNVSAAARPASSATSSDKGKLIGRDGKIYDNATAATNAGTTAVAKIIYIGTTGHATYTHGLALALTDEAGTQSWQYAATTGCNTYKNTNTPVTNATWLLASQAQWNYMITAAGSYTALRDGFSSVGGSNLQSGYYWSSTEYDSSNARDYDFASGGWKYASKGDGLKVRACLAF